MFLKVKSDLNEDQPSKLFYLRPLKPPKQAYNANPFILGNPIDKELCSNICFYFDDVACLQECWRNPALHSEVDVSAQPQSSILSDGGLP